MPRKQTVSGVLCFVIFVAVSLYAVDQMDRKDVSTYDQSAVLEGSLNPELKRVLAESNFVKFPQYLKLLHQLNAMLQKVSTLKKTKQYKAVRVKVHHLLSCLKDKQKKYTLTMKHYAVLQNKANQLNNQIEEMIISQKMQKNTSYRRVTAVSDF